MSRVFPIRVILLAAVLCLGFIFCCEPVFATTYSFQSPGTPGQEGVLSGSVTYDPDAVRDSLKKITFNRGARALVLDDLGKNGEFSFEYISPHSGVKHSEETICTRNIYDLDNGLSGNEVIGGKEGPFFDFSDSLELVSVDFRSCVGSKGDVNASISERDPQVAFSELESQFNQLKFNEEDYAGGKPGLFKKRLTIKYTLEDDA
ncbi:hypothetical protein PN498_14380 [Oscillatoria sp. CS-180]|uniref:hypothetical protein n=1 Tax=Oscillatoria sp. CS-180 TaxID=3021720 RepID=UPI0023312C1B|nr:hypothetical protein [Oscillatoria sp. CS-180]MDB9527184.1 hypothetical protein [Oscillatoria sp. CS-180]